MEKRVASILHEPLAKTHTGPLFHCYGQRCEWNSTRHSIRAAASMLGLFPADLSEQHPLGHQKQSLVVSRQSPEWPKCPLRLEEGAQMSPFRNWQVKGIFNQNRKSVYIVAVEDKITSEVASTHTCSGLLVSFCRPEWPGSTLDPQHQASCPALKGWI